MPAAVPHVSAASLSAQGYVRPNNEDRVHCDEARGIFIVVDGMGGHAAGEEAATIALERLRARLERVTDTPEQRLREAVALANNAIFEAAQTKPEWRGMACVLTAAIVAGQSVTVGHVGDSRLYRIRNNQIQKITRDHSPVGEREDAGEMSEADAMRHPRRNEVFRDVGTEPHAPDDTDFVDILQFDFEREDALLLCSDGLTDAITADEILRIVLENAQDPPLAVRALVTAATRIGHDNVSVVLVEGDLFSRANAGPAPAVNPVFEGEAERTGRLVDSVNKRRWSLYTLLFSLFALAAGVLGTLEVLRLSRPHPARVITISPSTSTIAAALGSARPGDTVSLGSGRYSEVVHLKNGVDVVAQSRREAIIEGTVLAENTTHVRLEGVQVHSNDVGIVIRDGDVVLVDDEVSGAHDTGIKIMGTARTTVTGSDIRDNPGIGIAVLDGAASSIMHNVFAANGVSGITRSPALLVRSSGAVSVNGNIFAANDGESVWLTREDPLLLRNNAFTLGWGVDHRSPVRILKNEEIPREGR